MEAPVVCWVVGRAVVPVAMMAMAARRGVMNFIFAESWW